MRPHYHIWLIGAACALAVLVAASIFSLLDARDPDGAYATPTSVLTTIAPPGDLAATAIGPTGEGHPPAFARTPATHHALRMAHAPAQDRAAARQKDRAIGSVPNTIAFAR